MIKGNKFFLVIGLVGVILGLLIFIRERIVGVIFVIMENVLIEVFVGILGFEKMSGICSLFFFV